MPLRKKAYEKIILRSKIFTCVYKSKQRAFIQKDIELQGRFSNEIKTASFENMSRHMFALVKLGS